MKTIQFQIITPEKAILKDEITQVVVPTEAGDITVLPEHIPLVSNLRPGVVEAKKEDGSVIFMAVSGGFLEVSKEKIVILADTAERAEEIDSERVKEARLRAEKSKAELKHQDQEQFAILTAKLAKELARERAVSKWRKLKN